MLIDLSPYERGEAPAQEMTTEWGRRAQIITLQEMRRNQPGTHHSLVRKHPQGKDVDSLCFIP